MPPSTAPGGEARLALMAGIGCYLIWGFVPLVFQAIGALGVGSWEILAHRTLWGTPTALIFVLLARQWRQVVGVFSNRRVLACWLTLSAALIAANWSVFIWAVNSGRVLESSLGYYITPLINMAAGALIFRERIDRIGAVAMGLAVIGVAGADRRPRPPAAGLPGARAFVRLLRRGAQAGAGPTPRRASSSSACCWRSRAWRS